MRIHDIISEDDTFQKYRELGQRPLKLVGHLAKKVFGGEDDPKAAASNQFAKPGAVPKSKTLGIDDTKPVGMTLDKVITGQQLDDQDIKQLKKAKATTSNPEEITAIDRALRGASLDSQHMLVLKKFRYKL